MIVLVPATSVNVAAAFMSSQAHVVPSVMSQFTQVPPLARIQYESSAVVGAMRRAHTLYAPAVGTLNVCVDQPAAGAAAVLLFPAVTMR